HTFPNGFSFEAAGSQLLTATDVANSSITGSGTVTVTPAAATQLHVSAPATSPAGAPFTVTVSALDAYGNIATGYTGTVSFSSSDGQASLPGSYSFTTGSSGDNGRHIFPGGVTLQTFGAQTVSAGDGRLLPGSATVTVGGRLTVLTLAASPSSA